ncbi:hypothetical protein DVK85_10555 [Flavobacterium arcticum]|uniref:Metal-dependent HD superfamily phosphohydrolase n=1 Tax=Flavobacterium arcticum TaxID=1784713 RepID=A0A345HDI7_9FLAO|nr:hypothetical protein [Flavobacterium arcticum]AXG74647.1 hypothetical protein DVK85_10555 [Flavobacterium arcticum]KAF2512226.1 hypothetical protein E0W72_03110 [Flavobacterium arcticum]
MIKDAFYSLLNSYTSDKNVIEELWTEIETKYSNSKRHYHTLKHLENMYNELTQCHELINDWDTILFSLFYHDIIYNATKKDNEEKSAIIAIERLNTIGFDKERISNCNKQILATKSHITTGDNDTDLFTDIDLSILGSNWENYTEYYRQVRKEYSIYPDILYNPGRKKVLQHFLDMDYIFKSSYYRDKYEDIARNNIAKELALL